MDVADGLGRPQPASGFQAGSARCTPVAQHLQNPSSPTKAAGLPTQGLSQAPAHPPEGPGQAPASCVWAHSRNARARALSGGWAGTWGPRAVLGAGQQRRGQAGASNKVMRPQLPSVL